MIGDDVRLEGNGVAAGHRRSPFSLPYAAGSDPQREAAIEEMRRILGARGAAGAMASPSTQRISVLAILMPKPSRPT